MKKRILSFLLCFCLISVLFPTTVFSDSPTSVTVGGIILTSDKPYLANGASAASADRPSSDGYAFFDADSGTLTLHDAVIAGAANDIDNYGIYSLADLTIILEGNNSITADDATFDDFFTPWRGDSKGIFVDDAALTVTGSGSLTVTGGETPVESGSGNDSGSGSASTGKTGCGGAVSGLAGLGALIALAAAVVVKKNKE